MVSPDLHKLTKSVYKLWICENRAIDHIGILQTSTGSNSPFSEKGDQKCPKHHSHSLNESSSDESIANWK